jgi:hypothetical protein
MKVSALGLSLVPRSPTKCGSPECDLDTPRRPRPTTAVDWGGYIYIIIIIIIMFRKD